VLLDEVAAGTDPEEGSALAQALLARLARRAADGRDDALPELKEWASASDEVANAANELRSDSGRPLYRVDLGRPGTSHALRIAGVWGSTPTSCRMRVRGSRRSGCALPSSWPRRRLPSVRRPLSVARSPRPCVVRASGSRVGARALQTYALRGIACAGTRSRRRNASSPTRGPSSLRCARVAFRASRQARVGSGPRARRRDGTGDAGGACTRRPERAVARDRAARGRRSGGFGRRRARPRSCRSEATRPKWWARPASACGSRCPGSGPRESARPRSGTGGASPRDCAWRCLRPARRARLVGQEARERVRRLVDERRSRASIPCASCTGAAPAHCARPCAKSSRRTRSSTPRERRPTTGRRLLTSASGCGSVARARAVPRRAAGAAAATVIPDAANASA